MSQDTEQKKASAKERHKLKKFVKELEGYRGRGTELVTVYVPTGYDMAAIINHLQQEQGTATNIKSKQTRTNVIDSLERMIQHLKLFKQTPPNGLCAFSGNVAEREGQSNIQVWSIEPPIPLNQRLYRCDKTFILDSLIDMVDDENVFGLVVMDLRDATIGLLKGKSISTIRQTHSEVPGKMRAGGQCLSNDTLVQLSDGSIKQIAQLSKKETVLAVRKDYTLTNTQILDKWATKKSAYEIITRGPRSKIIASGDHTFLVNTQAGIIERKVTQLQTGDHVLLPEKITIKGITQQLNTQKHYNSHTISVAGRAYLKKKRLALKQGQATLGYNAGLSGQTAISVVERGVQNLQTANLRRLCTELKINYSSFIKTFAQPNLRGAITLPQTLNEEFSYFIGYLLGDGCIEDDRITFFEQEEALAKKIRQRSEQALKMKGTYRFREDKQYHQLRFTSRPLVRLIREEFPQIKKALNSEIPEKVLQSPDSVVAYFLKGFFDAEGYVHNNRAAALSINNKILAQQVQLALLRFSIISSVQEYDNRANKYSNNVRFTVDITEKESLKNFVKHIGFTSKNKHKKLMDVLAKKTDRSYTRLVVVSGAEVKKIIEEHNLPLTLFKSANTYLNGARYISKTAFEKNILQHVKDKRAYEKLQNITKIPVVATAITKIEPTRKTISMTDISTKEQNFLANGIFVHNSAPRFARLREQATKEHYKKVADYMKEEFLGMSELKGILIGGPDTTINDFLNHDYITGDVKKKILGALALSYTGEFGLQELVDKADDLLAAEEVAEEKKIMGKFFYELSKDTGLAEYGEDDVMKAIQMGAVEIVLLSESLPDETVTRFEEEAEKVGSEVTLVSTETREGEQLKQMGKVAAILRYATKN